MEIVGKSKEVLIQNNKKKIQENAELFHSQEKSNTPTKKKMNSIKEFQAFFEQQNNNSPKEKLPLFCSLFIDSVSASLTTPTTSTSPQTERKENFDLSEGSLKYFYKLIEFTKIVHFFHKMEQSMEDNINKKEGEEINLNSLFEKELKDKCMMYKNLILFIKNHFPKENTKLHDSNHLMDSNNQILEFKKAEKEYYAHLETLFHIKGRKMNSLIDKILLVLEILKKYEPLNRLRIEIGIKKEEYKDFPAVWISFTSEKNGGDGIIDINSAQGWFIDSDSKETKSYLTFETLKKMKLQDLQRWKNMLEQNHNNKELMEKIIPKEKNGILIAEASNKFNIAFLAQDQQYEQPWKIQFKLFEISNQSDERREIFSNFSFTEVKAKDCSILYNKYRLNFHKWKLPYLFNSTILVPHQGKFILEVYFSSSIETEPQLFTKYCLVCNLNPYPTNIQLCFCCCKWFKAFKDNGLELLNNREKNGSFHLSWKQKKSFVFLFRINKGLNFHIKIEKEVIDRTKKFKGINDDYFAIEEQDDLEILHKKRIKLKFTFKKSGNYRVIIYPYSSNNNREYNDTHRKFLEFSITVEKNSLRPSIFDVYDESSTTEKQ